MEFFIAKRLAAGGAKRSVMVRIATISVSLSLAVMIVALSVVFGFKREIGARVAGVASDVNIVPYASALAPTDDVIPRDDDFRRKVLSLDGVRRVEPYLLQSAVAKSGENMLGVALVGVDKERNMSFFEQYMVQGRLPRIGGAVLRGELLLSAKAASSLGVKADDRVELLFFDEGRMPRSARFKVVGVYSAGLDEVEEGIVYGDIRDVGRVKGVDSTFVSGYSVTVDKGATGESVAARVNRLLADEQNAFGGEHVVAVSATEQYAAVFDWLRTHDVNALVIVLIMMTVSLLNMSVALLIIVFGKSRTIGVLKALGMSNRSVARVFVYVGLLIAVRGLVWGNVVGVGVALLQQFTSVVKLDASGYVMSSVPIALDVWWIVGLNVLFAAVIFLVMRLPSGSVARVEVAEVVKYV